MTDFKTHTIDSAPEGSKAILQGAQNTLQFVPNLYATMAEAPALLEGYTTLATIFDKTSFTETERQIVLMTNNLLNGCTYCMSAHTALSKMGGVPDDVIESLRSKPCCYLFYFFFKVFFSSIWIRHFWHIRR